MSGRGETTEKGPGWGMSSDSLQDVEPTECLDSQVAYLAFQQALVLERWILRASVTDMGLFRVTGQMETAGG